MWSLEEFLSNLGDLEDINIEPIFKALSKFNMSFFSRSKEEKINVINEILNACSAYIENIPRAEREYGIDENLLQQKYPNLNAVNELEKKAYLFSTMKHYHFNPDEVEGFDISKNRYLAKARWGLINDILGKGEGKALDMRHWHEYRTKGVNDLYYQWLQTNSRLSYREAKEQAAFMARTYLDNPEPFQVHFQDGKMWVKNKGNLVLINSKESVAMGEMIYAIDTQGKMYVSHTFSELENIGGFQHSSFLKGKVVICAGRVHVEEGILKSIDTSSGHYKPTRPHLVKALKILHDKGIDLRNCTARDSSVTELYSEKNAQMYLHSNGYCLPEKMGAYVFHNMLKMMRGYDGQGAIPDSELSHFRKMLEFCADKGEFEAKAMLTKELYTGQLIDKELKEVPTQLEKDKATALEHLNDLCEAKAILNQFEIEYINNCIKNILEHVNLRSADNNKLIDLYNKFNEQQTPSPSKRLT